METRTNKAGRIARVVRVMTVAPFMALVLLSAGYLANRTAFGGVHNYLFGVLFLTVLPVLGYPLQPILPGFKGKGREGQRNLAIVMAVLGYVGGLVYAAVTKAPKLVWVVFLTYFISGLGIVLFNKVFKVRASGHACGVAGPAALCAVVLGNGAAAVVGSVLGLGLLVLTFWASLKMRRHTLGQLLAGSIIPVASFGIAWVVTAGM